MNSSKRPWLAALAASALIATGCGSGEDGETGTSAPAADKPPERSAVGKPNKGGSIPQALADNRAQANQILDAGTLDSKLASLEGHPIVVNQWASWCDPCRAEFPFFAESAEAHAADVAFVGIDMQDDRSAAEAFLAELPIPYPSIDDPAAEQITSLGGGIVSPTTVFIDEKGEIAGIFQGAYVDRDQLEADIEKFLLN